MAQTDMEMSKLREDVLEEIEKMLEPFSPSRNSLIPALHVVQEKLGYIPYEAQSLISTKMNVPLTDVYGVVTFYSRFTLSPTGKYKVGVCLGTACYVKGADKILAAIEKKIGIKAGETTEDGLFSIDATRCIGACGLAPVITVNEDVYGKLNVNDVEKILEKYK